MSINVMHDLETLDTKDTAVVLSIGAIKFTVDGLFETFYRRLELNDQIRSGRTISGSTIEWWAQQDVKARAVFSEPAISTEKALLDYADFLSTEDCVMWGNGAMFDNAILLNMYDMYGMPRPWSYRNDRCYRTVLALHKSLYPGFETNTPSVAHNALADAVAQARTLQKIWNGDQV